MDTIGKVIDEALQLQTVICHLLKGLFLSLYQAELGTDSITQFVGFFEPHLHESGRYYVHIITDTPLPVYVTRKINL
jgi:hypothetical protein